MQRAILDEIRLVNAELEGLGRQAKEANDEILKINRYQLEDIKKSLETIEKCQSESLKDCTIEDRIGSCSLAIARVEQHLRVIGVEAGRNKSVPYLLFGILCGVIALNSRI